MPTTKARGPMIELNTAAATIEPLELCELEIAAATEVTVTVEVEDPATSVG